MRRIQSEFFFEGVGCGNNHMVIYTAGNSYMWKRWLEGIGGEKSFPVSTIHERMLKECFVPQ